MQPIENFVVAQLTHERNPRAIVNRVSQVYGDAYSDEQIIAIFNRETYRLQIWTASEDAALKLAQQAHNSEYWDDIGERVRWPGVDC